MNWQYVEIERLAHIRHEQLVCEADHQRLVDRISGERRPTTRVSGLRTALGWRFAPKSR